VLFAAFVPLPALVLSVLLLAAFLLCALSDAFATFLQSLLALFAFVSFLAIIYSFCCLPACRLLPASIYQVTEIVCGVFFILYIEKILSLRDGEKRNLLPIPVCRQLTFSAAEKQTIKKINRIDASVGDVKDKKVFIE